ncbi:MAG TPA: hypothetical protein PKO42_01725 [Tenuifilaceae bacterium]|jgi:hypothetical protein|nr:hypothetical protein [Bacteroidales bacterium]MBP8643012.1 hypothetical protein [Bacteroidales bacterium]HNY08581.1 hypothetical protein [Tenuifilaceae bacterium]HPS05120.1 hypothetical protein [Tenuifilaceae bacterium]HRC93352.1 hypothetical protein [Tenuifilaceae bacterium]
MSKINLTPGEINDLIDLYQTEIDRTQRRIENLKSILKKIDRAQEEVSEPATRVAAPARRGRKKLVESVPAAGEAVTPEAKVDGRKVRKGRNAKAVAKSAAPKVKAIRKTRKSKANAATSEETKLAATKRGRKANLKSKVAAKKSPRKESVVRKKIKSGAGPDKVKWIDLIQDILRSKQNLMLANSLTVEAMERLGIDESDRDRVRMAVATNLTRLTKNLKLVVKFKPEGSTNYFYGLTEWFDEGGNLKSEFQNKLM